MPTFELTTNDGRSFQIDADTPEMARKAFDHAFGAAAPPEPPAYSGTILPVSRDAQGNPQLDWNAGIPGMLKRAFTLPGDVYTGQTPILNNNSDVAGEYNPDLIRRSVDLAGIASPANVAMRAGDRAFPGALKSNMVPGKVKTPTAQQLKDIASKQYDSARAAGVEIRGSAVAEMARGLQQSLQSERGIIAKTAPKTFSILDELANPPAGGVSTIPGIDAARRGLSSISREGGTEGLAAGSSVRGIDDFLSSLNDNSLAPSSAATASAQDVANTLRTARANYAAAQRSNDITSIGERAAARAQAANSGRNLDNAIRQRVQSLLEKPKEISGYSDDEIAALRTIVDGGFVRNRARYVGNIFGGGGGLGQIAAAGLGAAGGASFGGYPGAAAGAVAPAVMGVLAKSLANNLAKRSLSKADELVRKRSPLYQDILAEQPIFVPGLTRDDLLARLMGLSVAGSGVTGISYPAWGALAQPPQR